jgi:hypothetical protein
VLTTWEVEAPVTFA